MSRPERQLRLVQGGEILFIVLCFFVKRIGTVEARNAISPGHWLVILLAIWSGVAGFTLQRRINRGARWSQNLLQTSAALRRWRAGHLIRLSSATAVGMWGVVLHYTAGPEWLVNVLLGLAVLLLLIWRPGATPAEAQA
jgi:hypothetical protein